MSDKKVDNLRWWILLTVIIGTFLGRLDQTIVNLALPKIINDFGITVSSAGWIATAYFSQCDFCADLGKARRYNRP
jgi:predicted MFS family arabinose efflux permease